MEMNLDLIRYLLMKIEESPLRQKDCELANRYFERYYELVDSDYDYQVVINYHNYLLHDGGFILADVTQNSDIFDMDLYSPLFLTFEGTQLLNSIRDVRVWKKVEEAKIKVASLTIPIIQKIAEKAILGYIDL